jgi:hypothetical protein
MVTKLAVGGSRGTYHQFDRDDDSCLIPSIQMALLYIPTEQHAPFTCG